MSEAEANSFRYWQSQADKRQNRIVELEERLKSLESGQTQQVMQTTDVPPQGALPPRNPDNGQFVAQGRQELPEVFPDPPQKPQRPRNFSRSEAYADDNSESARYLDELDDWRTQMTEYSEYRNRWQTMKNEEREKKRQFEAKRMRQQEQIRQQQIQKLNSIANHLKQGYQASDDQIADFMKDMSNRTSLTVDNMWKLYALNKGIPINGVPQQEGAPIENLQQPSPEFIQQQRAQQVPNPMGVLPANSSHSAKSEVDIAVDEMLRMARAENPFASG